MAAAVAPSPGRRVAAVVEYQVLLFGRTWRGSLVPAFVTPLLFLAALGLGLGSLVRARTGDLGGVSYLRYIAPGLLATTTMQTAAVDMTYPVLARIYWERTYEAMLATPLTVADVVAGEVLGLVIRMLVTAGAFTLAMLCLGAAASPGVVLAVPVAVLVGVGVGLPVYAFTTTQHDDVGFAVIQRFLIVPLFLVGGAFFPLDRLPLVVRAVASLTPVTHGVAACRDLTLGTVSAVDLGHVAVVLVWCAGGLLLALAGLRRAMRR